VYLSKRRLTMELSRERRRVRRRRASGVRRLLRFVGVAGAFTVFPSANSQHQPAQLVIRENFSLDPSQIRWIDRFFSCDPPNSGGSEESFFIVRRLRWI
jgi:hypothetical protein